MGPYCKFCDNRCFLLRVLRDGRSTLLATCPRGMEHDRKECGEDHTTALNPVTDAAEVQKLVAELAELNKVASVVTDEGEPRRRADSDPAYCGYCDHHADQHDYETGEPRRVPCADCPGEVCVR